MYHVDLNFLDVILISRGPAASPASYQETVRDQLRKSMSSTNHRNVKCCSGASPSRTGDPSRASTSR